jgi:flagellar P-ring protein precursor FlgI
MRTLLLLLSVFAAAPSYGAVRLKDIASFEGMRENQLVGYGLVVGLNGTGDKKQSTFSAQSLANLLQRMGVAIDPTTITVKNTAAVIVTATLPAFAQPGTRIDVTAATIGDAANLQGGLLVLTSLRAPNGVVYAVAQGGVVTSGFSSGRGGNLQTVNHPTVGRIPNGAIVERAPPTVPPAAQLRIQIHEADFTTAGRIASAINQHFKSQDVAQAQNSALVCVNVPTDYKDGTVVFMGELENLKVEVDRITKVIVNERTGTIVMGKEVRIAPVAILQGNLAVQIKTEQEISQPSPLSNTGNTAVVPQTSVATREEKTKNVVLTNGATVQELVQALAAIGSTARDVIAILQGLRAAGALEAELEVI